jgi:hypothetical protein
MHADLWQCIPGSYLWNCNMHILCLKKIDLYSRNRIKGTDSWGWKQLARHCRMVFEAEPQSKTVWTQCICTKSTLQQLHHHQLGEDCSNPQSGAQQGPFFRMARNSRIPQTHSTSDEKGELMEKLEAMGFPKKKWCIEMTPVRPSSAVLLVLLVVSPCF